MGEIKALTGVRALAALWVLTLHFGEEMEVLFPWWKLLTGVTALGELGVDVFFVLSGFIIAYVYLRQFPDGLNGRGFKKFVWFRFARVYPNHAVTLIAIIAMVVGGRLAGFEVEGNYGTKEGIFHGVLLHAWPGVERGHWNYPSWSISAEWFAYVLVFPLVVTSTRAKVFAKRPLVWCYAALAVFLVPHWCGWLGSWDLLVRVSAEFFAGGMLYLAFRDHEKFRRWSGWACSMLVVAMLAAMLLLGAATDKSVMVVGIVLCVPVLLAGLAEGSGLVARFFSCRAMLWGGHISYALYLVHALVEKVFKVLFSGVDGGSGVAARYGVGFLYFVASIGAAAVLYYVVEEPTRKWLRRVWQRMEASKRRPA